MASRALSPTLRAVVLLLVCLAFAHSVFAQKATAPNRGPDWPQLNAEQQKILAPLKDDWSNIEGPRRQKWLEIAKRYPSMTPEQQNRLQSRMKHWASLSHDERAQARDRYKQLKQLPPEKRAEVNRKWQEYQNLPEEQKENLRKTHPQPAKPQTPGAGKPQAASGGKPQAAGSTTSPRPGNADKQIQPGSAAKPQPVSN